MAQKPKVLVVLPSFMAARILVEGNVLARLDGIATLRCLTSPSVAAQLTKTVELETSDVSILCDETSLAVRLSHRLANAFPNLGYRGLAYRFNEMNGFVAHRMKKKLPAQFQRREMAAGNFVAPYFGFPFPRSSSLYAMLSSWYWRPAFASGAAADALRAFAPDVLVLGQAQGEGQRDIIRTARKMGIPVVGNILSWDQPTTKGPVPPGLARYIVQNEWMKECLRRHHGVETERICVVGWAQMDGYRIAPSAIEVKAAREAAGVSPDATLVLFGLYSARLGQHEPEIARQLVQRAEEQQLHILLRPHPKDKTASERFKHLLEHPRVTFAPNELDDLELLREQILMSDVVLTSGGTIALDAAALDRPALFLGEGLAGRPERHAVGVSRYSFEHLASVLSTGAVPVVESIDALLTAIQRAGQNPAYLADERERLRQLHLKPLDSCSAERFAAAILSCIDVPEGQIRT